MDGAAELLHEETPPESGVRVRVRVRVRPAPAPALPRDAEVVAEAGEQVFFEVLGLVRALQPLQGPWLSLGVRHLGAAALTALSWPGQCSARTLRRRWPELVPGYSAMDRLAWLLVDRLCDPRRAAQR